MTLLEAPARHAVGVPAEVWVCHCGQTLDGACDPFQANCRIDPEAVIYRLEQAGATLLAMRGRSPYPPAYRCALPEVLHDAIEAYGWTGEAVRPAIPSAAAISRMDVTLGWLAYIPSRRYVLRRIVAARALVSPTTGRHLLTWRRLGHVLHMDHHAAQRWHRDGIGVICDKLTG